MAPASPVFRQAVSHSAYSAIGTVSVFLTNFLFAGLTIRFLGNEQAGYFIVVGSLFAISQAAGGLGLTTPATKRAAELYAEGDNARVRRLTGSVLLINGVIGVAVVLCCIVGFPQIFRWSKLPAGLSPDAFWATVFLACSFVADQAGASLRFLYAACLRQDLRNYTLAGMGLAGGVVKIVWLACYPTMPAAAAATLTVSVTWLALDVWLVRKLLNGVVWPCWSTREVKPLAEFSLWELLNAVGICAGNTVDRIILTTYLGAGSVPVYAIAQRFFQQIHGALAQQFSFIFPLLASTGAEVHGRVGSVQDRARWLIAALGAVLYIPVFLIGPPLIALLIGPEFAEKARWPIYLVTFQGLAFAFVIANYFLHYAVGNGSANAGLSFGNNIFVTIFAFLLIPRFDYIGASLAQLNVVFAAVIFLGASKRILRLQQSWGAYWSTYVSPLALFFVALTIGKTIEYWLIPSLATACVAVAVGYAGGAGVLVAIESRMFPSFQRLGMLGVIYRLIKERMSRRPTSAVAP